MRAILAAATAMVVVTSASADVGRATGPACVRLWTRALMSNDSTNSFYGTMRQVYASAPAFVKGDDPIDFMAGSCHMDPALAETVVEDEVRRSNLSRRWNLPPQEWPQLTPADKPENYFDGK